MLVTDATENYLEFQRAIIYYLVNKLGQEVEINHKELNEFMQDPKNLMQVKETETGFAIRVMKVPEEVGLEVRKQMQSYLPEE